MRFFFFTNFIRGQCNIFFKRLQRMQFTLCDLVLIDHVETNFLSQWQRQTCHTLFSSKPVSVAKYINLCHLKLDIVFTLNPCVSAWYLKVPREPWFDVTRPWHSIKMYKDVHENKQNICVKMLRKSQQLELEKSKYLTAVLVFIFNFEDKMSL